MFKLIFLITLVLISHLMLLKWDEMSWLAVEHLLEIGRSGLWARTQYHGPATQSLLRRLWIQMTSTGEDGSGHILDILSLILYSRRNWWHVKSQRAALLRTYREREIPAKQKPSKKRRVLNMGTLTEKATVRPNTSMNSTDMISTGWRPNLRSKVRISFWHLYVRLHVMQELQKSYQSARIPNTKYPKMDPTNRENFAMWTFHAESHTRLHCRDK